MDVSSLAFSMYPGVPFTVTCKIKYEFLDVVKEDGSPHSMTSHYQETPVYGKCAYFSISDDGGIEGYMSEKIRRPPGKNGRYRITTSDAKLRPKIPGTLDKCISTFKTRVKQRPNDESVVEDLGYLEI